MLRVCITGATGWAGPALVAAVSRSHVGKTLGEALGEPNTDTPVFGSVADALELASRLSS